MQIEIIVTNQKEAILAEEYGASRLELIHGFELGGLSPKPKLTPEVSDCVNIPVNIMLRPHGDSFIYSVKDIKQILNELEYIRDKTKANGIVFGALDKNNNIDCSVLKHIINNKGDLQLTFHRAIDASSNIIANYTTLLNDYPEVDFVLTSGGATTALDGIKTIKNMLNLQRKHKRNNAQIIVGSGITTSNLSQIINQCKIDQLHLGRGVRDSSNNLSKIKFRQLFSIIEGTLATRI